MKKKLAHFEEINIFPHVFQPTYDDMFKGFELKGKWHTFFKNDNPITLELGCGKGEYTVALAKKYPERNFIGVDIKGARIWHGAKHALEEQLPNVAFLRTHVDIIEHAFSAGEVSQIWITFPDPQPREAKVKKRLTSPLFNSRYKMILSQDGIINLKTDDAAFYQFTLETIQNEGYKLIYETNDLYNSAIEDDVMETKTFYEMIWLKKGKNIHFVKYSY